MKEMQDLLKSAIPPCCDLEPRRDLWPEMRRRIESAAPVRFGVLDWVVAGMVGGSIAIFPKLVLGLLYQL